MQKGVASSDNPHGAKRIQGEKVFIPCNDEVCIGGNCAGDHLVIIGIATHGTYVRDTYELH